MTARTRRGFSDLADELTMFLEFSFNSRD
jgi:hypothetical protein